MGRNGRRDSRFQDFRRNSANDSVWRKGLRYYSTCRDDTALPDFHAIKHGDLAADPAVPPDLDAFSRDALVPYRFVQVYGDMVFGMAAEILPNDAFIADFEPSRATEVSIFPNADVVADDDGLPNLAQCSRHDDPAKCPNSDVVSQSDSLPPQGAEVDVVSEFEEASKLDFRRIEEAYPSSEDGHFWIFPVQQ